MRAMAAGEHGLEAGCDVCLSCQSRDVIEDERSRENGLDILPRHVDHNWLSEAWLRLAPMMHSYILNSSFILLES